LNVWLGLNPRLLSKVVLLKRLSRRDLVWNLGVLVETELASEDLPFVSFAYSWLVSPLSRLVRLNPLVLQNFAADFTATGSAVE